MTKLDLLYIPDSILHEKAEEVSSVNDEIRGILDNMMDIMYEHDGIGLAGNQVGVLKRLVVIDCPIDEADESEDVKSLKYKMVNPKITWHSRKKQLVKKGACQFQPV